MPSFEHEALVELFRHRHLLAVDLAEVHGLKLPAWRDAVPEPTEAPDTVPSRNADVVMKLTDDSGKAVFALVVEVQRGRDDEKQWSWPLYLTGVRHRLKCPTAVLVICTDDATATWAYKPIELGPGAVVSPFPVGPNQVPVVTDPDRARESPQLAVLSALAHGGNPDRRGVLDAVPFAYESVGKEWAALYHDLMAGGLPEAALKYLGGTDGSHRDLRVQERVRAHPLLARQGRG